jgi:pentatricopeptide repeat protein
VQDEELRKAVEDAFPDLDISSSPSNAGALPEENVQAGASVDPGLLVEALAQSPSTIRQIAQKATASAKADALAQARAALLDPAVISNWDKVVVGDWDPLPIPVRGSFADRRGVVRSAANPPKPHPLTCLSALYREVVALFDPQGIDAILNRRRDEGSIQRSELIELIKRLGEAGANVKKPLAVFRWMQMQESQDLRPVEASYSVMIRLLGKLNAADEAVALLREMEESGLEQNVQTYNALLSGLAK